MWSRKSYPLRVIFFELLPQGERRQRLNIGGKVHICLWSITLPWNASEVERHFWSFGGYADPSKLFGSNCALYLKPTGPIRWGTGSSVGCRRSTGMLSITGMLSAGAVSPGLLGRNTASIQDLSFQLSFLRVIVSPQPRVRAQSAHPGADFTGEGSLFPLGGAWTLRSRTRAPSPATAQRGFLLSHSKQEADR